MSEKTPPLYQIVNWETTFENAKSLGYVRPQLVCFPNKHGGSGLSNVQAEEHGAAIYGVWAWIVQMCSRQSCGRYEKIAGGKQVFRSERAGYLTADGKKDGRRLSARELSNMFRRPIKEILLCLHMLQRSDIGFIRLIEGVAEDDPTATPLPESATTVTDSESAEDIIRECSPGIPDCSISNNSTEEKRIEEKRKKEEALSGADKGSEPRSEEHHTASPLPESASVVTDEAPDPVVSDPDLIQHSEAKQLIGDLAEKAFDRKVREADWRNPEKYHWLDRALPLARNDWQALSWLYSLPLEHRALKMTARVQSFEAFLEHLRREIDKSKSVRRQLGRNGQHGVETGKPRMKISPEQIGAAKQVFGPDVSLPEYWEQLSESVRDEIEEAMTAAAISAAN